MKVETALGAMHDDIQWPGYPGDTRSIRFDYGDYRRIGPFSLPASIHYVDAASRLEIVMQMQQLEVNVDLDDALFLPTSIGTSPR